MFLPEKVFLMSPLTGIMRLRLWHLGNLLARILDLFLMHTDIFIYLYILFNTCRHSEKIIQTGIYVYGYYIYR